MNLFPPPMLDLGRTVGVRPENIQIVPLAGDHGKTPVSRGIAATVDFVEPLGSETLVHCLTDDRNVKVTVRLLDRSAAEPCAGQHVVLLPDMEKAVSFESGQ